VTAPTAEALMRSRYSAFATGDADYLLRSWHRRTRPRRLQLDPDQRWVRLEILGTTGGGLLHAEGTVEFRAHYQHTTHAGVLHELSRFTRENGEWRYVDGDTTRPR
jgi:SEC-C motif-containing protein